MGYQLGQEGPNPGVLPNHGIRQYAGEVKRGIMAIGLFAVLAEGYGLISMSW